MAAIGNSARRQVELTSRLAARLKIVRALWMTIYTLPKDNLQPLYEEFFFAIGEVLEGVAPEDLHLTKIPKDAFLKELPPT